jgi:hypothetical protein
MPQVPGAGSNSRRVLHLPQQPSETQAPLTHFLNQRFMLRLSYFPLYLVEAG